MSTPHNKAQEGEIAEKVLLAGDPLRAKYIAENYLEDAVCYNDVRGMLGYTGMYNGKRVSIQGVGMGIPSMLIYATELIEKYGAKRLIRVGTCGTIDSTVNLRDLIIAMSASSDSNVFNNIFGNFTFAPTANFEMLNDAYNKAKELGMNAKVKNIFTSDLFYDDDMERKKKLLMDYGISAIEMETASLYLLGAKYKVDTLSLLTVSDSILTGEGTTPEERQTTFGDMVKVALEII